MTKRQEKVEEFFFSVMNNLLREHGITLIPEYWTSANTLAILAINENQKEKFVCVIWPEWGPNFNYPGIYIVCVRERRGIYLNWQINEDGTFAFLATETTDEKPFLTIEQASQSEDFKSLADTILIEFEKS